MPTCSNCGNPKAELRCSQCKKVYYCNIDCQRSHWKIHKHDCRKPEHTASIQSSNQSKTVGLVVEAFSPLRGRHFVATRDIEPGELICSEEAYVMIPMENKLQKSCFYCCRALKGEQHTRQAILVSSEETVLCSACGSKYCSLRCKEEASALHAMECQYLPKLREVAKQTEMEFSFVCFLVRILIQRHLEMSKSSTTPLVTSSSSIISSSTPTSSPSTTPTATTTTSSSSSLSSSPSSTTPASVTSSSMSVGQQSTSTQPNSENPPIFALIRRLLSHSELLRGTKKMTLFSNCVKKLQELLPKAWLLPENEMIELFCIINVNAWGVNLNYGAGIFPKISLFNHSCIPNCVLSNVHTTMYGRAISKIKAGEEVVVSYVELYLSTEERQQRLAEDKFFICKCKRCREPLDSTRVFLCRYCKVPNNASSLIHARTTILLEPQCAVCSAKHRWYELKSLERSLAADMKKGAELERQGKQKEALQHYESVLKKYQDVQQFRSLFLCLNCADSHVSYLIGVNLSS